MDRLDMELAERRLKLNKLAAKMKKSLRNSPAGRLRITGSKGKTQYCYCADKTDKRGKYIPKSNYKLAKALAQRDYYLKALRDAAEEVAAVETLIELREHSKVEDRFGKLVKARQDIVTAVTLSDEEYARRWQAVEYKGKGFKEGDPEYYSLKNERMRSKSEVIIANILYELGIPYRYEYPLELPDRRIIYPDFLILNVNTREEFYYEHFGRMGDAAYSANNVDRMNDMIMSGLIPGKNFICTFETETNQLNTLTIRKMLEELFL